MLVSALEFDGFRMVPSAFGAPGRPEGVGLRPAVRRTERLCREPVGGPPTGPTAGRAGGGARVWTSLLMIGHGLCGVCDSSAMESVEGPLLAHLKPLPDGRFRKSGLKAGPPRAASSRRLCDLRATLVSGFAFPLSPRFTFV